MPIFTVGSFSTSSCAKAYIAASTYSDALHVKGFSGPLSKVYLHIIPCGINVGVVFVRSNRKVLLCCNHRLRPSPKPRRWQQSQSRIELSSLSLSFSFSPH